jgi:suppressor of ftsI
MPPPGRSREAGGMVSALPSPPSPPTPPAPPAAVPRRRRRRLAAILIAVPLVVVLLVIAAGVTWFSTNSARPTPPAAGAVAFDEPLRIPELAPSTVEDGVRVFDLEAREGRTSFLPGSETPTLGYNGSYLGPTLVATRGERVRVDVTNSLAESTTVHWHGMHLPAAMDGGPHSPIAAGADWQPEWTVDQPAASLWYHPHLHGRTREQVDAGLAGMFIVQDEEESALALPRDYGVDDIPVIVQDRSFGADGAFAGGLGMQFDGVLGDTILVNGAPWPFHEVSASRYRFRVLNASNARRYELELDPSPPNGPAFIQIGSDGGLLAEPVNHDRLEISPAERYDIVIDFGRYPTGTRVTLNNRLGDGSTGQIMQFHVTHSEPDASVIPAQLSEIEPLDPDDAATTRTFRFHSGDVHGTRGWVVDDDPFHPDNIAASPNDGDIEIWELRGNTDHPIHLHLVHFQVLSRDGNRPAARDAGWKDTVNLNSGEQVRVIARFTGYRGKYVFHCHNLEHEDMAMMANFEVV